MVIQTTTVHDCYKIAGCITKDNRRQPWEIIDYDRMARKGQRNTWEINEG